LLRFVPDLTALVQCCRWPMVGAAIPAVNSSDGCHGCSSHVGSVTSGRVTQTVKHPPFVYIFSFFGNNLLCNRQYIYQYRNGIQPMILFLPPLKLNLSVYLRPCAIFCAWAFFWRLILSAFYYNAFYFDAFYGQ
jgi:hypothetical protein